MIYNKPPLSSLLHFLVELTLILVAAATFALLIIASGSSPITEIQ